MKERPILSSAPMVRAILDGKKTQTRRIMKPQPGPEFWEHRGYELVICDDGLMRFAWKEDAKIATGSPEIKCPFGMRGDQMWVRETWGYTAQCDDINSPGDVIAYRAGGEHVYEDVAGKRRLRRIKDGRVMCPNHFCWPPKPWKPSVFMPRWASRITLEITNVLVERLNDISEDDAIAEGIERMPCSCFVSHGKGLRDKCPHGKHGSHFRDYSETGNVDCVTPEFSYRTLWESINGPGSWDLNPWVWVIEFKRVNP